MQICNTETLKRIKYIHIKKKTFKKNTFISKCIKNLNFPQYRYPKSFSAYVFIFSLASMEILRESTEENCIFYLLVYF